MLLMKEGLPGEFSSGGQIQFPGFAVWSTALGNGSGEITMRFLTYDSFIINTKMPPHEVRRIIGDLVEQKRWVWRWNLTKPFRGEIRENTFKMYKAIRYRNSFLPIVCGEILTCHAGTMVRIIMRPCGFTIAFLCVFIGMMCFQILDGLGDWILYVAKIQPLDYASMDRLLFGMAGICIIYLFSICGYKFESIRARSLLYEKMKSYDSSAELAFRDKLLGLSGKQIAGLVLLAGSCSIVLAVLVKMIIK
jgi:hypothetical protein